MSRPGLPTSRLFVTQLLNSLTLNSEVHNRTVQASTSSLPSEVPEKARKPLLSLQVLFPNEFVPALDLLDRHLVTRFRIRHDQEARAAASEIQHDGSAEQSGNEQMGDVQVQAATSHQFEAEGTERNVLNNAVIDLAMTDAPQVEERPVPPISHENLSAVYYVQSAQQRSSRYSTSFETTTFYEVRLQAWNCSCPAFAFAAFPATHPEPSVPILDPSIECSITDDSPVDDAREDEWKFGGVSLGDNMPPVCKHLLACVLAEKCSGIFGPFVEEKLVSVEEAAGWAAGWGD